MARPKQADPKRQYTVMMKPDTVQEIDRLAKKLDLSRSQLMSNLIQMGLDDARTLEKSGALWVVTAGKKAYQFFKEQVKGMKGEASTEG
jgi:metal-responsive CopG/Arc/MetJ family transcriptional regulator